MSLFWLNISFHCFMLLILTSYALVMWLVFISSIFHKQEKKVISRTKNSLCPKITVFIPAHEEGEGVNAAIESVLNQKYSGKICVKLLIKDQEDSSFKFVKNRFKLTTNNKSISNTRKLEIVFCKISGKSEKINFVLPSVSDPYIAILDADHRAHPLWLQTSLDQLLQGDSIAIQGIRAPLSLNKVSEVQDSVQNHVGNELVNSFLDDHHMSVGFTGTTALFSSEVLKNHGMPNSITEDTFLTYDLLLEDKKISYNREFGSFEETSPNFQNYLLRRRRWASGHDHSLCSHYSEILNVVDYKKLLFFIFHGHYFLVPLITLMLLYTSSFHYLSQISMSMIWPLILLSFCLGGVFSSLFIRSFKNYLLDSIFSSLVFFPIVVGVSKFFLYMSGSEFYYYILSFPLEKKLTFLYVFLIFSPLVISILSLKKYKLLKLKPVVILIFTFPFYLIVDIVAALLGLSDFLLKQNNWYKIKRTNLVESNLLPDDIKNNVSFKFVKKSRLSLILIPLLAFLFVITHDLILDDNCGYNTQNSNYWLFNFSDSFVWKVESSKKISTNNDLIFSFKSSINEKKDGEIFLDFNGKKKNKKLKLNNNFIESTSLGFNKLKARLKLTSGNKICYRDFNLTNKFVEIKNKTLLLNGSPFLIKGVIPNFAAQLVNLSVKKGVDQIKSIGANSMRFYHTPTTNYLKELELSTTMIVAQPDQSTWNDVNLSSDWDKRRLVKRFVKLKNIMNTSPVGLISNLGNELEMGKHNRKSSPVLEEMLSTLPYKVGSGVNGYSTFYTFIEYPSQVLGVNMLDTGDVYWRDAYRLMKTYKTPVYASEFGGFVAHFELPPVPLRAWRMVNQWKLVSTPPYIGGLFFQSHDNWAQPLAENFNDPTKAEWPDDLRGLWDLNNNPKVERNVLASLYSDIKILNVEIKDGHCEFRLENKRPYSLNNVKLRNQIYPEVLPFAKFSMKVPESMFQDQENYFLFEFLSHKGLKQKSLSTFPFRKKKSSVPAIFAENFINTEITKKIYNGIVLTDGLVKIKSPESWNGMIINDVKYNKKIVTKKFSLKKDINSFSYSQDGKRWSSVDDISQIENLRGQIYLKMKIPQCESRFCYLFLAGIANISIEYNVGEKWFKTVSHPYRDWYIDVPKLKLRKSREVILRFNRKYDDYINPGANRLLPDGLSIKLSRPYIVNIPYLSVKKL